MLKKILYSIILIIFTSVSLYFFNYYRKAKYTEEFTNYLSARNNAVKKVCSKFFQNDKVSNGDIRAFLDRIKESTPSLAAAAYFENNNIILGVKNNNLVKNQNTYKEFAKLYQDQSINSENHVIYKNSHKFYITEHRTDDKGLLLVYGHVYPHKIKLSLIFENIAVSSIIIALITIIFYKLHFFETQSKSTSDTEEIKISKNNDIDTIHDKNKSIEEQESTIIYNIFKYIYDKYSLKSICFSIYNETLNSLYDKYILSDNNFTEIQQPNNSILESALITELKKGSLVLKNNGKTIIIPMKKNGLFNSVTIINSKKSFTGNDNNILKNKIFQLSEMLNKL